MRYGFCERRVWAIIGETAWRGDLLWAEHFQEKACRDERAPKESQKLFLNKSVIFIVLYLPFTQLLVQSKHLLARLFLHQCISRLRNSDMNNMCSKLSSCLEPSEAAFPACPEQKTKSQALDSSSKMPCLTLEHMCLPTASSRWSLLVAAQQSLRLLCADLIKHPCSAGRSDRWCEYSTVF